MSSFCIHGAQVLFGQNLQETDLNVHQSKVVGERVGHVLDGRGYLVLPGIVDLHGDGFEHHLAPRKGAIKDLDGGLVAAHSEIAANGITTAVMAQFYSWEGGMRGAEFAKQVFECLAKTSHHFGTDLIPQLRFEYLMRDQWDEVLQLVERFSIPYFAFNDHVPHDALAKGKKPPRLTGQALKAKRSPEVHWALLQTLHDGKENVWDALGAFANALKKLGVKMASHDDRDASARRAWSDLGVAICEFPETIEAAYEAQAKGEPVIMGAPNVLRGASHKGNVSALDLVEQGLCTALASDYHYPSLARAAFLIADRIGLAAAWDLVALGPATILGLSDRGILEPGKRADFMIVTKDTRRIEGVFASGRPTFLTGILAERFISARNAVSPAV